MSPPAVIIAVVRPAVRVELEIVPVRRIPVDIGALLAAGNVLIDSLPVQPPVEGPAVIEHTVHDHANAAPVRLRDEIRKHLIARPEILRIRRAVDITRGIPVPVPVRREQRSFIMHNFADVRVDVPVVLRIILVIRRRHKERIEINHIDPKLLEIVQLVQHALQIPAIEAVHIHILRQAVPILHSLRMQPEIFIFICQHIIGLVPVAEPVHVNLVDDCAAHPVRHAVPRNQIPVAGPVHMIHHTVARVQNLPAVRRVNIEIIGQSAVVQRNNGGIPAKFLILPRLDHLVVPV